MEKCCGNCSNGEDYKGRTYCNENKKTYDNDDKICKYFEPFEGKSRG